MQTHGLNHGWSCCLLTHVRGTIYSPCLVTTNRMTFKQRAHNIVAIHSGHVCIAQTAVKKICCVHTKFRTAPIYNLHRKRKKSHVSSCTDLSISQYVFLDEEGHRYQVSCAHRKRCKSLRRDNPFLGTFDKFHLVVRTRCSLFHWPLLKRRNPHWPLLKRRNPHWRENPNCLCSKGENPIGLCTKGETPMASAQKERTPMASCSKGENHGLCSKGEMLDS